MKTNSLRSDFIALAKDGCALCQGLGLRRNAAEKGVDEPCKCVYRAIFRVCHERFKLCSSREKHLSHARLEQVNGKERSHTWGLKDAEYIVDFCNIARHTLTEEEHRLFRFHFLLGADWKMCCRRLNLERGLFFHAVYRIQQKLGEIFRDLKPYGLYPLDEYFGGTVRKENMKPSGNLLMMPSPRNAQPLRPPLRKVA